MTRPTRLAARRARRAWLSATRARPNPALYSLVHDGVPPSPTEPGERPPAWDVLVTQPREATWVRARRLAVGLATVILLLTGALTIAGQFAAWFAPSRPAPRAVPDREFDGAAVTFAVDYLSWDETDRVTRHTALARLAAPGITTDGWDGTGRQWADSPTPIGIVRGRAQHAVVTVRLRVLPFTADQPTDQPDDQRDDQPDSRARASSDDGGPNVASGPLLDAPGWTPRRPRWLNLAVPLDKRDGRVVVTATPALVGSPPTIAEQAAVPANSTTEDAAFAHRSRGIITTLLRSYASGELEYARAERAAFVGLHAAADLEAVTSWRVTTLEPDADRAVRLGDVTVTWALSGDAGALTCTYRVELHLDAGRWYLASIGPPTEAVT